MTKIKSGFLWLLVFMLSALAGNAQYNDAGLWTKVSVETKLVRRLHLEGDFSARFNENVSQLSTAFVDLSLSYKLHDLMDVQASYRFGGKRQPEDYFDARSRMAFDVILGDRWRNFKWSYRLRSQFNTSGTDFEEGRVEFGAALRNKLELAYKARKKTWLWSSMELFSNKDETAQFSLSDWRWKMGIDRSINKKQSLGLAYQVQKEVTGSNPVTDYVVLLTYKFDL